MIQAVVGGGGLRALWEGEDPWNEMEQRKID